MRAADVRRTFADPPAEYGPIDGWWWEAGRLDRARLRWQLEEFKDKGIAGTWFYGRYLYDEPLASDPRYLSDGWWEFTRFAAEEQERLGLRNFFSVWTGLEFEQDAIRGQRESEPGLWGRRLVIHTVRSDREGPVALELPEGDDVLDAAAYAVGEDALDYGSRIVLTDAVRERRLEWKAPGEGWLLTVVAARPWDLDYLSPEVGQRWNDVVLAEYERRLPGMMGSAIEGFGPDEMSLLNGAVLFAGSVIEKVRAEAGFDPLPALVGLFYDIGPKTDRIRCNYHDAVCALLEDHFYQAPTRWLHERGMVHGTISQNGSEPLSQTYHYGDFLRYMRSFDIPGNEDPGPNAPGERTFLHTKVTTSVAHLYGQRRAVVLAHYSSGWGHTFEENVAWTNESYAKGMTLYSRHLGSYSLMGGWYEYVPPHDHFYHPYWRYWKHFADYVRRLSLVLSQGRHRADVALLYPTSTIHAHWTAGHGEEGAGLDVPKALEAAAARAGGAVSSLEHFSEALHAAEAEPLKAIFGEPAHESAAGLTALAEAIYRDGIDFDFVDNSSLARATVRGDVLEIGGVEFRCLLLPPVTTVPIGVIELAKRFFDAGGAVGGYGRLPHASVEEGRGDPRLLSLIDDVFGVSPDADVAGTITRGNDAGGRAFFVPGDVAQLPDVISDAIVRDFVAPENDLFHTHQALEDGDVYFVFNTAERERELAIRLRVDGDVEAWDPFTGQTRPIYRLRRDGATTEVVLRMQVFEGVVLVCSPGTSRPALLEDDLTEIVDVAVQDGTVIVDGLADGAGVKRARVVHDGREYAGEAEVEALPEPIVVDGPFAFRLESTMDNRFGDFRHPPSETLIGAEARRFRYREEESAAGTELGWQSGDLDDSDWPEVTYSYGPYWRHLGPFVNGESDGVLERALRGDDGLDWRPYSFSKRFGAWRAAVGWPGVEDLLGVPHNFLVLDGAGDHVLHTAVDAPEETELLFVLGRQPEHEVVSTPAAQRKPFTYEVPAGTQLWVNGDEIALPAAPGSPDVEAQVRLRQGTNDVLLKIVHPGDQPKANYAVFVRSKPEQVDAYVPELPWFGADELVYDIAPAREHRVGWYRFQAPPGVQTIRLRADADAIEAWVDGRPVQVEDGEISLPDASASPPQLALRVAQRPGTYAGAVFPEPVTFDCGEGEIQPGDWSEQGLAFYSGIGVYTTRIELTADHLRNRVLLDLGQVKTVAEVSVNGRAAGVRITRPFRFDITELVREGENRIEVKVANTLANHMSSYPTKWIRDGQTVSGLLGPVRVSFLAPVRLVAAP